MHTRRQALGEIGAAAFVLAALAVCGPALPALGGDPKAAHVVTIENMRFEPATLTVKKGERVTWVNKDLFPHTATAEAREFDSGAISANGSWTFQTRTRGTFGYRCVLHPTMTGSLVVV